MNTDKNKSVREERKEHE